jgi:hypothetical protein
MKGRQRNLSQTESKVKMDDLKPITSVIDGLSKERGECIDLRTRIHTFNRQLDTEESHVYKEIDVSTIDKKISVLDEKINMLWDIVNEFRREQKRSRAKES